MRAKAATSEENNIIVFGKSIGYKNKNTNHLREAFNLTKIDKESDGLGRKNYKNAALATLGDAVAKAVLAESLYNEGKDKGEITKEKSEKEANKQFEKIAAKLHLHEMVYNDEGITYFTQSGHNRLNSDYATLFEAVVGAVYLDLGFVVARKFVLRNTMAFDEALAERIRHALSRKKEIEEKKGLGGMVFMLRGNMLVGVWKDSLVVHLGEVQGEEALLEPHVKPFCTTGKPMKNWVLVKPEGVEDEDLLKGWIQRAVRFVGKMPGK